ncbi:MAG: hypothetical protein H8K07_01540 [Nitrospira sp.]|nr:hypothetical protein [Nitrospira sp.]
MRIDRTLVTIVLVGIVIWPLDAEARGGHGGHGGRGGHHGAHGYGRGHHGQHGFGHGGAGHRGRHEVYYNAQGGVRPGEPVRQDALGYRDPRAK